MAPPASASPCTQGGRGRAGGQFWSAGLLSGAASVKMSFIVTSPHQAGALASWFPTYKWRPPRAAAAVAASQQIPLQRSATVKRPPAQRSAARRAPEHDAQRPHVRLLGHVLVVHDHLWGHVRQRAPAGGGTAAGAGQRAPAHYVLSLYMRTCYPYMRGSVRAPGGAGRRRRRRRA